MNDEYKQVDYEEGVIGATFNHWDEAREYQAKLRAEDFTDPSCATCWKLFSRSSTMDEYLTGLSKEKLAARASGCSDHDLANMPSLLPWSSTSAATSSSIPTTTTAAASSSSCRSKSLGYLLRCLPLVVLIGV